MTERDDTELDGIEELARLFNFWTGVDGRDFARGVFAGLELAHAAPEWMAHWGKRFVEYGGPNPKTPWLVSLLRERFPIQEDDDA